MIPVTKPFLPPKEEYIKYLDKIWESNWLTNNGPLLLELEERLNQYLNTEYICYVSNGTIALQMAIKALCLKGEIITTPFSYVATTSSIVWEDCTPVFADIDRLTLNIDPLNIERRITSNTSAILATHVYGNPCDIEEISRIAHKYNLKVIYDAAHAFSVKYKGESIFKYGDISTTSFHATKIFHTVEGGAIFTKSEAILKRLKYIRNFGHDGPGKFNGVGINGKNSEFHAAMGLCNLNYITKIIEDRKRISDLYDSLLEWSIIRKPTKNKHATSNYSYYPILFESEKYLVSIKDKMNSENIYPRRYFYPALDTLDYVSKYDNPVSDDISKRVLCLPIYHNMKEHDIIRITEFISKNK